jgi:tyrosyl-tRNA synthetase
VWLNPDLLSSYDYWQFWRNTEDADVGRFLRLFTLLPLDEVARLERLGGAEINEAKKVLATEATALVHGRDAALQAEATARATFEEGAAGEGLPTVEKPRADLAGGLSLVSLIVEAGLAASNSEVRRAIANNAVSINDAKVSDPQRTVTLDDASDGVIKLSLGRKRHALVRATG